MQLSSSSWSFSTESLSVVIEYKLSQYGQYHSSGLFKSIAYSSLHLAQFITFILRPPQAQARKLRYLQKHRLKF